VITGNRRVEPNVLEIAVLPTKSEIAGEEASLIIGLNAQDLEN
jgi:hypothetical protein